jgi:hypothetical protein
LSASQKLHAKNAPSPAGQSVIRRFAVVAKDKSVEEQLLLDTIDRASNARVGGREKPNERHEQETGVDEVGPVGLHECVDAGIESVLADIGMDLISQRAPAVDRPIELALLGAFHRRDPRRPMP